MKRAFFIIILTFFTIFFTQKSGISFAQETVIQTDTPIGVDTLASESANGMSKGVNYELPYPGMLPDNPLYIFKVIRDGIVKLLINDELTKARFSLKNAEKRIYAGKMLVEKGKDKLAVETIAKGNNYLDDALSAIKKTKAHTPKNTDIKPFLSQARTATMKFDEIYEGLIPIIDQNRKAQLLLEQKRTEKIKNSVEDLLRQK